MASGRVWILFACIVACARVTRADDLSLPLVSGELAGDYTPLNLPGAPTLHWKLALAAGAGDTRAMTLAVDGPGTALRSTLELADMASGTWRIEEAQAEIAPWFAALVPRLGREFAGAAASGHIELRGEGSWRDGALGGRGVLTLREAHLDDPAHKLSLDGVTLDLTIADLTTRRSAPAQTLTWTGGRYDVVQLGAGRVVFAVTGDEVRVAEATLAAFGGELRLGEFVVSLARPEFAVTARAIGLDVQQLLPLLPPVLADAHGRVDGELAVKRDASGLQIGAGRLALRAGESADLRLAPRPGLLSASLPPTVLKYYPGLGQIETGQIPLRADLLEVEFTPEGDAEGRTASVHLAGGPVDPKLRAPVDLVVNVRGPLQSLLKLGTDSRLHFGGER
ncbi:MAG TPA: YdbH domain-containing protein [Opitutaceae bacterium]|nr:YdbH domain-containing protein [Opitutaceae bacterium]